MQFTFAFRFRLVNRPDVPSRASGTSGSPRRAGYVRTCKESACTQTFRTINNMTRTMSADWFFQGSAEGKAVYTLLGSMNRNGISPHDMLTWMECWDEGPDKVECDEQQEPVRGGTSTSKRRAVVQRSHQLVLRK
jgi:hypothetical protein